MRIKSSFLCLLLFCIATIGCKKEAGIIGKEPIVTTHRTIAAFDKIAVYDNINLILVQDTLQYMNIVAASGIASNISTTITGGVLTLKNTSSFKWLQDPAEKINLFLHYRHISNIAYYGSGDITSANILQEDYLQIESIKGAGNIELNLNANTTQVVIRDEDADIILHGNSNACVVYCTPKGSIDLRDFVVADMDINLFSIRDAYVNVSNSLKGEIQYKGNIYYKGHPSVIAVQTYDTGRLIEMK